MPNMWKKKKVEQGYNYLNGPIQSMAVFFEIRIENLEKSIPSSVPSRNKKKPKKGSKKRKLVTFGDPMDEIPRMNIMAKVFASTMVRADKTRTSALL